MSVWAVPVASGVTPGKLPQVQATGLLLVRQEGGLTPEGPWTLLYPVP